MTFTSIPPSLRPVVEDVARTVFGNPPGVELCDFEKEDIGNVILAFLNACVERGAGKKALGYFFAPDRPGDWIADSFLSVDDPGRDPQDFPALILNLGATDDTA